MIRRHFLTIIFIALVGIVQSQTVKVMTYNLRFDNPEDGPNAWPNRKDRVMALLKKQKPDFFGVQEALLHQLNDISTALPQYKYVGVGRDDGKEKGEFSAIFYDEKKYSVAKTETFWLSETPAIAGSKSWDAAITRVVTWAKLVDIKSGDTILFVNTHFDHIGKEAREKSAQLIKEKISLLSRNLPVILTGDFNIEPTEPPYKAMTNGEVYNFRDAGAENTIGTFCTFKVNSEKCRRIDYIFHGVGWEVKNYSVITQNNGKYYPSDHLPVVATLKYML